MNTVSEQTTISHPREKLTLGQRAADKLTTFVGSWAFILFLFAVLLLWVGVNTLTVFFHWDPYPFILLNLFLSTLAAVQAPIILMSQNRQAERDRLATQHDYKVDIKAEEEIKDIQKDLEEIKGLIKTRHP